MRLTPLAIILLVAVPATTLAKTQQVTVVGKKKDPREDREDRVTCKTFPVTGTLAQTRRVCMAASHWRQERDDIQSFGTVKGTSCSTLCN